MSYSESSFYGLAEQLYPICRSITGDGVRQTLKIISQHVPLTVHEVPTGTEVFDWVIPQEWNVRDAYIIDYDGNKLAEFGKNNLHLLNYSTPYRGKVTLEELQGHLYSLPEMPTAIPYVTSYYEERWGFCLPHKVREKLHNGIYEVVVDTELKSGSLTLADLVLPGKVEEEILISTYTCHPSMGNNEVSGMTVTTIIAKWLMQKNRHYTYRIVFGPETIGPVAYMATGDRLQHLKSKVIAAFNMTCVGDDRAYSLLPTKWGDKALDRLARHVMGVMCPDYKEYSFCNDRGSDECQYSSPRVDLPMVSIMRTRYGSYPEYHTSLDDMNVISGKGMKGAFDLVCRCLDAFEFGALRPFRSKIYCEPFFSKHNLRATIGAFDIDISGIRKLSNVMMYADGEHTLVDLAEMMHVPVWDLYDSFQAIIDCNLIEFCDE